MSQGIIDWLFTAHGVANADDSLAATVQGTMPVNGPGDSTLGPRPAALAFRPGSSCRTTLSPASLDVRRFAVRVLFRATAAITTRHNLIESTAIPFAMYLEPGQDAQRFNVVAAVENAQVGWTSAGTANRVALEQGRWYVASLVYDLDTLALLIGDTVIAVAAFPAGDVRPGTGDALFVGTWVDGARWPFTGEIAGVQVWHDIPEALEVKSGYETCVGGIAGNSYAEQRRRTHFAQTGVFTGRTGERVERCYRRGNVPAVKEARRRRAASAG